MPQTITLQRIAVPSPPALWHLLSLDAPTVATLWLLFVAHTTHTQLPPLLAPAMFLAVWLIYAADRILDTTRLLNSAALEPRHRFHQRYRIVFLAVMVIAVLVLSLVLAETRLPTAYLPLAAIFLLYFAAVHLPRVPAAVRLPKELATGLIFAAAVFAPELPHQLLPSTLFAVLCTLNCAWITRWESPQPTHLITHLLLRSLTQLTAGLLLSVMYPSPITACIALSAATLLTLNYFRSRFAATTLRAAADLALMTPILFLWAK